MRDALLLVKRGNTLAAAQYCTNIVRAYPTTAAARQARAFLATLEKSGRQFAAQVPAKPAQPPSPGQAAVPRTTSTRPPAPAAAPIALTPEQRAAGKFKLAMALAEYGKTAAADQYCTDIIKSYPGTAAAGQAQAFLDQHDPAAHPS